MCKQNYGGWMEGAKQKINDEFKKIEDVQKTEKNKE